MTKPYNADKMEELLDEPLWAAITRRRTARKQAVELADGFSREDQDAVLHWAGIITRANTEMAFQFVIHSARALCLLGREGLENWVISAMDVYDRQGMYPAIKVLANIESYAEEAVRRLNGLTFKDVHGVLEYFVNGLSVRRLKLASANQSYTDTETLYVPAEISVFADEKDNFVLYKLIVVHQWAQIYFGTFARETACLDGIHACCEAFNDPQHAMSVFHALECIRLDACIKRELAGLAREQSRIQQLIGDIVIPDTWQQAAEQLQQVGATVEDSLNLLSTVHHEVDLPLWCYQGMIDPAGIEQVIRDRQLREKRELIDALIHLVVDLDQNDETKKEQGDVRDAQATLDRFDIDLNENGTEIEITLDDKPLALPVQVKNIVSSIVLDFGEIPPDILQAAGEGTYNISRTKSKDDVWQGTYHEEGAFIYDEWDFRRKHYRKDWCVLREVDIHPKHDSFVSDTLSKYRGLLAHLRKTFEMLRGENRLLRREKSGDDIDINALIEAIADNHTGMEMTDRLFTRLDKQERNVAVLFMVDMSGSTEGWINRAEREALVLLCESLEVLGDRYAIYGFSGTTRNRCELYTVKPFDESYDDVVKGRISGISAKDYTRMGVVIRHLSKLLGEVEARTRLLITLSDGKPDDYDGYYRGEYGIEDTRQSLIEARRDGIHPFCITIDTEGSDYLPHMYGAVNYTIIDDVRQLPVKVSEIYRRLTT
ncbi:hypothetical protein BMS3Bbin11_01091 [bacterium BMS3Bbin11]|nr:hypothetical protein BMS3Abin11_00271 [bacterium BMS3Abin11]GBE45998.1 hypothetical protein BMS3Bbin11_01091 [bacterium BMS3Bbin11]HDH08842.1 nitric oxide reductase activation protein [Gammaproteobacteria bacterium]